MTGTDSAWRGIASARSRLLRRMRPAHRTGPRIAVRLDDMANVSFIRQSGIRSVEANVVYAVATKA